MTVGLLDGDVIAYRCSFAAQWVEYELPGEGIFRHHRDMLDWLSWNVSDEEALFWRDKANHIRHTVIQPVGHALTAVDTSIAYLKRTVADTLEIYYTGSNNFRKFLDYPVQYKGGRPPKPVHYTAVRDYLRDQYGAIIVDDMEADDMLGIRQMELNGDSIIMSNDKDLDQIAGVHYDLDTGELYTVKPEEADHYFHLQWITGDRTDNICGIRGMGPVKAKALLDSNPKENWESVILNLYNDHWGENGLKMFETNKKMLWIKRER